MSDKSKLRSQIRAAVKSKINDIAGSSWKKYFAPILEELDVKIMDKHNFKLRQVKSTYCLLLHLTEINPKKDRPP